MRLCALAVLLMVGMLELSPKAHAQKCDIKTDGGSVSICGNAENSTITIGVSQDKVDELVKERIKPLEELTGAQKDTISLLKEKLDLNDRQVRAALDILGEASIPPERLAAKLVEIAEQFKALRGSTSTQAGDDPMTAALKVRAQQAIDKGELANADTLLEQVEAEQRRALYSLALNAAETAARRGEIALARLRYGEAAQHFANAANTLPLNGEHEDKRIDYLEREASALYQQGREFGDNVALTAAIKCQILLLGMKPRERVPLDWAQTQNNLGNALETIGSRESGTARLDEAVAAYREALKERTRERVPLDWAQTQNNLGVALQKIGSRESGTAHLDEAVAAYRDALKEIKRERAPLDWAQTQNNLGVALETLGGRESGTARLDEAVAAYREALKEIKRERAPLDWAETQNNLGVALGTLASRENGTARLDDAVETFHEALKERTRERAPLDWAQTQNNLGLALWTLAGRESGMARLNEAVAAFREALKEITRERAPLDRAGVQNNLGLALETLGSRESGTAQLEEAVAAYREALKEITRERAPLDWAGVQNNLGVALETLGSRESGTARLEEAVAAYREALQEWTSEAASYWHNIAKQRLASCIAVLDERRKMGRILIIPDIQNKSNTIPDILNKRGL